MHIYNSERPLKGLIYIVGEEIALMTVEKLQGIGLTDGESKVYVALLQLQTATKSAIVKESSVSSSKVYEILDRLLAKGLVSTFFVCIKVYSHFLRRKDN